jgi:methyltransferase-like protein 6
MLPRSGAGYFSTDFEFSELESAAAAFSARVSHLPLQEERALQAQARAESAWSNFHSKHGSAFFKPRDYILDCFPQLRAAARILEIGAGSGSNVVPLIQKTNAFVYASDFTQSAMDALATNPLLAEPSAASRICSFLWDVTLQPPPLGEKVDATCLTFVASAVHPQHHADLFAHAAATLSPKGVLCFRDYASRDLAQLRAPPNNILSPSLHLRQDQTLSYFFTIEEVRALLEGAGLTVLSLSYARVRNVNRKTNANMLRCWVNAIAQKK